MIATTTIGSRYVQNTANNTEKCNVFFSHCSTIYDVTVEFESAVYSAFPAAVYHVYYITNARCVGSAEQRRWSSLDLCKILLMMCVHTQCNMYFKKQMQYVLQKNYLGAAHTVYIERRSPDNFLYFFSNDINCYSCNS
jgi:hypothetical protein